MRYLLLLLLITSCGTYQHSSSQIESLLAVTRKGDTISVPYSQIVQQQRYERNYRFNWNYGFNNNIWWNNGWNWGNQFWGIPYTNRGITRVKPIRRYQPRQPERPRVKPRTPRVPTRPKQQTRSYVRTPRGSSYVRPTRTPNTRNNANTNRQIQSNRNIGRTNTGRSRKNQ